MPRPCCSWSVPVVVTAPEHSPPGWLLRRPRDGCVFFWTRHAAFLPSCFPAAPQSPCRLQDHRSSRVASRVLPGRLALSGLGRLPLPWPSQAPGSPFLQTTRATLQSGSHCHCSHFRTLLVQDLARVLGTELDEDEGDRRPAALRSTRLPRPRLVPSPRPSLSGHGARPACGPPPRPAAGPCRSSSHGWFGQNGTKSF